MIDLLAALLLTVASPDEAPVVVEDDPYTAPRHFEVTMGFMGGVRDETRAPYGFSSGTAEATPFAQALATPFALAPYNRTIVYGLGWETRYVSQHVRFTMGLTKPFPSFRLTDTIFPSDVGGVTREIGTRNLTLWDVRTGLGTEYAWRYLAAFVDVVGDIQSVSASLTVDGLTARYDALTFGFAVRAGVRVHMGDNLFIAPMGEIGIGGGVVWGVSLQAGWVIPVG